MTKENEELKIKLEQIRPDLKYYRELTPENYINDRVLFKIRLYFYFGKRNKRWYNLLAVISIISGLLVPLFLNLEFPYSKQFATAFSLLAGGLVSLEAFVYNFREKFKNYKKTEDQLTNELFLYQTYTEPYKVDKILDNKHYKEDPGSVFSLFVSRVESIILKERDDTVEKLTRMSLEQLKTNHTLYQQPV